MNIAQASGAGFFRSRSICFAMSRLLASIISAGGFAYCIAAEDDESPVATAETAAVPEEGAANAEETLRQKLFAEYRFDGDTKDSSGANREATFVGPALAFAKDRNGKRGRALELMGNGGLDLGEGFRFASFSVAMWIKPAREQVPYANIIDNNHGDGINWVAQQTDSNLNQYHFGVGKQTGRGVKPKGAVVHFSLTPDKWQHLSLVKSSQHVAVYVDGKVVEKTTTSPAINYARPPHIRIGSLAGGGRFWKGAIDDVTLHQRALTLDEVGFLAKPPEPNALVLAPAPDISGAWLLSDGSVIDITQDASNHLSWPGIDSGFTYSTTAEWDGERFDGVTVRKNRSNGCCTELRILLTTQPDGTATIDSSALDNNCDLRVGFKEHFTLRRISPEERATLAAKRGNPPAALTAATVEEAMMLALQTGRPVSVGLDLRQKSQQEALAEFGDALAEAGRATSAAAETPVGSARAPTPNPLPVPATGRGALGKTRKECESRYGKPGTPAKGDEEKNLVRFYPNTDGEFVQGAIQVQCYFSGPGPDAICESIHVSKGLGAILELEQVNIILDGNKADSSWGEPTQVTTPLGVQRQWERNDKKAYASSIMGSLTVETAELKARRERAKAEKSKNEVSAF
jgi:hypothetical protein